jgi:hypothetical protein
LNLPPIKIGARVATVAIYTEAEEEDSDYWGDFFPLPVEYATNNALEISNELDTYPEEHWSILKNGINELNKPYKLGLFRIELETSDWKNT